MKSIKIIRPALSSRLARTSGLVLAASLVALQAGAAQVSTDLTFCHVKAYPAALRQTIIVIDGKLVTPEKKGQKPLDANRAWRLFARKFLDPDSADIGSLIAPRERVTVAIAKPDGSGLLVLFSGCVPHFSAQEVTERESRDGAMAKFFGTDWKARLKKVSTKFLTNAQIALVTKSQGLAASKPQVTPFSTGTLVRSMQRAPKANLSDGIPRYIFYTDLADYSFPNGTLSAVRQAAFADAAKLRLTLGNAEVHLFSTHATETGDSGDYLPPFFLGAHGLLKTLGPTDGPLAQSPVPVSVGVYQGQVDFGKAGTFGLRLRLARDVNGQVVDSWMEELRSVPRFAPVQGSLACLGNSCKFTGDNVFGQRWAPDPTAKLPECNQDYPFAGMRDLSFTLSGDKIQGKISDSVCYVPGMEAGLPIQLVKVKDGKW